MDVISYDRQCREKGSVTVRVLQRNGHSAGRVIVLYLEREVWDAPKELYDMLDLPEKEKNGWQNM